MKRTYLFVVLAAMAIIIFGCGGGGGEENNAPAAVVNYTTDKFSFPFSGGKLSSNQGSTENVQSKKISVPVDGESFQTMKTWNINVKKGDIYSFTFNCNSLPVGREVTLKIKNSAGNITYAEKKFIFQGKTIVNLSTDADDKNAKMHLMFGAWAGEYTLSDDILVERKRVVSDKKPRVVTIDPFACSFSTKCGSTRNSTGEIYAKAGEERWYTMLKCTNISIEKEKIYKFIIFGSSFPASKVVFKLESVSGQGLGEGTIELFGDRIVLEIIPTENAVLGNLALFFPETAIYNLDLIIIEISD